MTPAGTPLRVLQLALHAHLLGCDAGVTAQVVDDARLPAARRLGIYAHAYASRLQEALRETFEKTRARLGDDAFDALAAAFVRDRPSTHRNLRWFGAGLPAWLARALPHEGEVGELARLEWALRGAFDARDDPGSGATCETDHASVDWSAAGCRFTASLRVVALRFNAAAIWQALDRGAAAPPAMRLDPPAWALVWRRDMQARFRTIDAGERAWLAALRGGRPIAVACAGRAGTGDAAAVAAEVAAQVLRWRDEGVVTGFVARAHGTRDHAASAVRAAVGRCT